ncbi:MAG: PLP-dependent aspartate aminotransferase family protein [Actinomycetes bacterium]
MSNDPSVPPTSPDSEWKISTRAVSHGRPAPDPGAPVNESITLSSTFHAGGTLDYGRVGNPTWTALESTLADLESTQSALCFPSGVAAISAVLDLVPVGGVVVAPAHPYSGTRGLLNERQSAGRFTVREYQPSPTADISAELHGADLLWIETPSNPLLEISDIAGLSQQAHAAGALVAIDATFITPYIAQPINFGVDLVVHSVTKFLAGHSDVIMGSVATNSDELATKLHTIRTLGGAIVGPFEAFLALRGIRTLGVRMDRSIANAQTIAERLLTLPVVEKVRYPGLSSHPGHDLAMATTGAGAVVCFEVHSADQAEAIAESTRLWTHATSLGGVESLIERRARWPFEHPDVPSNLIRLSVGIEDVDDLWNDLYQAISAHS